MKTLLDSLRGRKGLKRAGKGADLEPWQDLRPVKSVHDGNALNKAGRLVLRGERTGEPVKLYECANTQHASFVAALSERPGLQDLLPGVLEQRGAFLVTEWITAGRPEPPTPEELARLLAHLHVQPLEALPEPGFDYWWDFIRPRFLRAMNLLERFDIAKQVTDCVDPVWQQETPCLMHPDLSPANLVRNVDRKLYSVDNELLGLGGLPLLDLFNTALALKGSLGQLLLNGYLDARGMQLLDVDEESLRAAWLARCSGAAFVGGKVKTLWKLVENYDAGENILPLDTNLM